MKGIRGFLGAADLLLKKGGGSRSVLPPPAEIRAGELSKQKDDRRDADLFLKLLVENGFQEATRSPGLAAAPSSAGRSHAEAENALETRWSCPVLNTAKGVENQLHTTRYDEFVENPKQLVAHGVFA